jgi:exodeoxyribonuclease VII large subunit
VILEPTVLTVTQLNTYIKLQFEGDENLSHVFVIGEISNFTKNYRSGHLYFSLKDEHCAVRAVMFARSAAYLRFLPEDGMKVIARGRMGVYEISGQYQLYVEDLQPDGLGALNLAFEQLKAKLEKEGLFSAERKKPLPKFPRRIGVITSPTGAAVHDILTILARRYPLAEVVFRPVQVQGDLAAPQIVDALRQINRLQCADVIIVGRGGGSLEDLWPFNEESVARAVAASSVPVISAVGHETDFTICDFAADLRAPTPSAAAELAVPDKTELLGEILAQKMRLQNAAEAKVADAKASFLPLAESRVLKNPLENVELRRVQVDRLAASLDTAAARKTERAREQLSAVSGRLNALSPLAVLSRGYAAVFGEQGKAVSKADEIRKNEKITVRMSDGALHCTVNEKKAGAGYEQKNDV